MSAYIIEITLKKNLFDAFGNEVLHSIRELGMDGIEKVYVYDVYKVYGDVDISTVRKIGRDLLLDPVSQTMRVYQFNNKERCKNPCVEVWYLPGVTDPVASTAMKGIRDLGIKKRLNINCGKRYEFIGKKLDRKTLEIISTKILANTLIHQCIIKGI
ncbi:MAG: phosphoribosylformylglycinamidine synthase [candidate division TA06 bacterium ADurb.Bin131]|uniref:Phosphoribosylformylglycinamidine synthase n=1 Tax=candidate division TA06 bacterium ADurb.Bin131 TaxID=1852827 RepID=A0A1V6CBE1_UNCT6|nr:MAG: phosphoribosylformylglycinamidine synthase [candidate division TA06 bacterium ADurb.Bin131]